MTREAMIKQLQQIDSATNWATLPNEALLQRALQYGIVTNTHHYTVIGKRWFDRINGNTYHSVFVYKDGRLIGSEAFDYGYGDSYQQCALTIIQADSTDQQVKDLSVLWKIKDLGHTLITSCTDVTRKRDL